MPKIVSARITASKSMFDVPKVFITLDDGSPEKFLFDYYPDEISFTRAEFVGLTEDEARSLKGQKDLAYLKS